MSPLVNNDSIPAAKCCIIWLHGLGASAADMAMLAAQLNIDQKLVRHIFLNAPVRKVTLNNGLAMRAWYDIYGLKVTAGEDSQGIVASSALIIAAIKEQISAGFSAQQIILAGFSQGGAMALYTAVQLDLALGGVIALSAYIPLINQCKTPTSNNSAFFIAYGSKDDLVLPVWTIKAITWLQESGYDDITWREYNMGHSVCNTEIKDLRGWLLTKILYA